MYYEVKFWELQDRKDLVFHEIVKGEIKNGYFVGNVVFTLYNVSPGQRRELESKNRAMSDYHWKISEREIEYKEFDIDTHPEYLL
jgi:hypothetical protein